MTSVLNKKREFGHRHAHTQEMPHQKPTLLTPLSWNSSPHNCSENFHCLSHWLCGCPCRLTHLPCRPYRSYFSSSVNGITIFLALPHLPRYTFTNLCQFLLLTVFHICLLPSKPYVSAWIQVPIISPRIFQSLLPTTIPFSYMENHLPGTEMKHTEAVSNLSMVSHCLKSDLLMHSTPSSFPLQPRPTFSLSSSTLDKLKLPYHIMQIHTTFFAHALGRSQSTSLSKVYASPSPTFSPSLWITSQWKHLWPSAPPRIITTCSRLPLKLRHTSHYICDRTFGRHHKYPQGPTRYHNIINTWST